MSRPLVIDTFMVNNEMDMLECRLTELGAAVDYMIAVEAEVDHQDHPKPFYLTEQISRFKPWADKLIVVQAKGLPTAEEDADPWAREHAQREYVWTALEQLDPPDNTIIWHGDLDEFPTPLVCRNVRPKGFVANRQRGHFWAVDYLYPPGWQGSVASTLGNLRALRARLKEQRVPRSWYEGAFGAMRDSRNMAPQIEGGWHFSWMGGPDVAMAKVGSFCHPEVEERIVSGLASDRFYKDGIHVDGVQMVPVEVDESWPRWIYERKCPDSWWRPR